MPHLVIRFGPEMFYEGKRRRDCEDTQAKPFASFSRDIYSSPTWLIQIFRSRLAIMSDGIVAQAVFKYPRQTRAAHHHVVLRLHQGGLLSLSPHESLLDNMFVPDQRKNSPTLKDQITEANGPHSEE